MVLCFCLLLFYGYLVQSQVQRGETFREAQHARLYVVRDGSLLRPARATSVYYGPLAASASSR